MTSWPVVYVGSGLAGKSTSLTSVVTRCGVPFDRLDILRGEQVGVAWSDSEGEHQVKASVSVARGRQIAESPAQADKDASLAREMRQIRDAAGLVFVIDSQEVLERRGLDHLERLKAELTYLGKNLEDKPVVFQANKRDLAVIHPMDWVRRRFLVRRCAYVESVATKGLGTLEALATLVALIEQRP